jgi:hypothetical protein
MSSEMMGYKPKWVEFLADNRMKEYWHANGAKFAEKAELSLVEYSARNISQNVLQRELPSLWAS